MAILEGKTTSAQTGNAPIDIVESLLAARYSCRAYKPEQVPRATIERILKVAQRTASWCNSQPWHLVITSGEETKKFAEVLYAAAASDVAVHSDFERPREYKGVYLERRRESGFQLYNTLGITRGDKAAYARQLLENFRFFGAPHVAIITSPEELGTYGAVDCGLYVSSFLIAAQALGLGTITQAALAQHADVIRAHFKIANDRNIVCGISFGFPDQDHLINSYRTSRASIDDAVSFVGT